MAMAAVDSIRGTPLVLLSCWRDAGERGFIAISFLGSLGVRGTGTMRVDYL
jgi:hypothetical protein